MGRQEEDRSSAMVTETRRLKRFGLAKVGGQVDPVEERPVGIALETCGGIEDVPDAERAADADDEDAEELCRVVLEVVVEADLPFPAIEIACGTYSFGPAVDFDEEAEGAAVRIDELEAAVGEEALVSDRQPERVLAVEAAQRNAGAVGTHGRVDDEIGEGACVVLAGDADGAVRSLRGRGCVFTVEDPIAEGGERVVVRGAAVGSGVAPLSHPTGGDEDLEAFADAAEISERVSEGLAQFQKLLTRERTARERRENVEVSGGNEPLRNHR